MPLPLGHGRRAVLSPGWLQRPGDNGQLRGGRLARGQLGLDGSSDGIVAPHSWLGPLGSATSWADRDAMHCLAQFLPDPTGAGWLEKGECPHLDDSELMVNTLGPGERSVPAQTPWAAPYLLPPLALQYCPSSPFPPLSQGYEGVCSLLKACGALWAAPSHTGLVAWQAGDKAQEVAVGPTGCPCREQRKGGWGGREVASPPPRRLYRATLSWAFCNAVTSAKACNY